MSTIHGCTRGTRREDRCLSGGSGPEDGEPSAGDRDDVRFLSNTLVLGIPGVGKTLLGLTFLAEGARREERGLIAAFHETETDLALTSAGISLDLARHFDSGLVRVLWNPPLELSADA